MMTRKLSREEELEQCRDATCVIELLGRKHMMPIIFLFYENRDKPLRYNQIYKRFDISPKTLSERLKELDIMGIIERKAFNEIPPRVEYRLTDKGAALSVIFKTLEQWAEDYKHILIYPEIIEK